MSDNIDKTLNTLTRKIILFDVMIFLGVIGLSIILTAHFKQRLAVQLSEAFRAPIIAGDNRQIMLDMSRPVFNDFAGFSWEPADAQNGFSVPQDITDLKCVFYSSVLVKLFFDETRQIRLGELRFYYPRWTGVSYALGLWFLLTVISVIFGYRERQRLLREYALAVDLQIKESRALIAAQVAHDIRSPLVALDSALKHTDQLPEKQRVIVRHAVNSIRDIANSLLEKNRQQPGLAPTTAAAGQATREPLDVNLLSSLINPVITEKRLAFESKPGISIDFELSREAYGLFARLQPVEFRRIISNLVNNAVEALGEKGKVDVRLARKGDGVLLTIADDGKGIPREILAKLGRRGETHGKAGGSGLGLYHARTTTEGWGGSLGISSEPGRGTTVTIELPKAEAPAYFAGEITLVFGRPVVVLDDDPGIHELWRGRFESARLKDHGIEIFDFSEPAGLRAWVKDNLEQAGKAVYLFDHELAGHTETGLSLAEELGLCTRTILITSHSEEKRIVEACAALRVRLIPKEMADIVPISAGGGPSPARAVLLDDSTITQMTWEMAAEEAGAELTGYTEPAKFLADLGNFPKDMPIYIDSELGGNVKGENIAAELKEKGFTNICLATAHPPERFAHLPWLKVRSKETPWGQGGGTV